MKANGIYATALMCLFSYLCAAQVASNVRPPENSKMGEFSEWQKVEASFDDGSKATIEYRSVLAKRMGVGCHYDVEVKNTSTTKLTIQFKSSYYDKLVKGNYGDEASETLKPDKSVSVRFVAQGCKKEKGVEKDDYGHCFACEFGVNISVSK